jgi:hypothetical protein
MLVTSPRDEIDDWLSGDVAPLYPPSGSLDQIRHRARKRKTRQVTFAAAGCAVVIAAAISVPQLISAGHQPGGANPAIAANSAPVTKQPSSSPTGVNTPVPAATKHIQVRQHSYLSATGSDTLVPPNFRPTSVTVVGTGTNGLVGAVIGQAGPPCYNPNYCTSLAGTSNYGTSWYGVSAPVATGPDGDAGVSQLRFANLSDGWAYGPGLYETSLGGWPWIPESTFGQRVIDVEAAAGHAYAVFGTCTGTGTDYAATCASFELYTSVAGSATWTPAAVPPAYAHMPSTASAAPLLVLSGSAGKAYLLTPSGQMLSGPITGGAWQAIGQAPCAPGPADVASQSARHPGAQLASGKAELLLTCGNGASGSSAQSILHTSADGAVWQTAGPVHEAGSTTTGAATSLASAAAGQVVLATTTGIQYSVDGGQAWQAGTFGGAFPAGGFSYVGMTTGTQGVAVPVDAQLGEIFVTSDGGKTWSPSPISG